MNKTLFAISGALLMLSFVAPASGYHIQPRQVALDPIVTLPTLAPPIDDSLYKYSSDFVIANPILILCESDGPGNPLVMPPTFASKPDEVNANPIVMPGIGGLCYSGQNPGTGPVDWAITGPTPGPKGKEKPYKTALEVFDLCALPTSHRLSDPGPGVLAPGFPVQRCNDAAAALGIPAMPPHPLVASPLATGVWEFTAQLGIYECTVQAHEEFYYSSRYAWMTWDAPVEGGNGHISAFPDLLASAQNLADYILANAGVALPFSATVAGSAVIGSGDNGKVTTPPPLTPCGGSVPVDGPTFVGDDPLM